MTTPDLSRRPEQAAGPAEPPALPDRRVLLVLFLSLAASAMYSLVNLVSAPIRGVSAPLYPRAALVYQLLDIGTSLVPVALVAHLLHRSRESMASIGLDLRRPLPDLALGAALALIVGTVGLAVYATSVQLGVNRSVVPVPPTGYWWTVPLLLLGALRSGLLEEVIVCGYLLRRLDQLGWSPRRALAASALLRASYHLYQGYGGFVGNLALGLFFGRIYQRRRRTTPLVVAHFLLDAGAGLGYLALRGRLSWLP